MKMNDRYGKQKKDKTGICESMGAESEKNAELQPLQAITVRTNY